VPWSPVKDTEVLVALGYDCLNRCVLRCFLKVCMFYKTCPICCHCRHQRMHLQTGDSSIVSSDMICVCVSNKKHPMGCEAQLAWKCLFVQLGGFGILTSKVGQTDLVFGVPSGFISRSVQARLQVSVCSGYNLWHPG